MRLDRFPVTAALVVAGESYLAFAYAQFGALFHYWLHGLTGAAAGIVVWVALGRRSGAGLLGAATLGRLLFAAPDVLFIAADLPHERWMEVFGAHISVHFMPAPTLLALVTFALAVAAGTAATLGRRKLAAGSSLVAAAVLVLGLAMRAPLPATLEEVRDAEGLALRCALPAPERRLVTESVSRGPQ